MRILVIGGTAFVGRHFVETALAAGHDVALFHRGKTGVGIFPDVEEILDDRDGDLAVLKGRSWDAVVDTCGYVPRVVHKTAELLEHATPHYTFVSSISVYRDFAGAGRHEGDALAILHEPQTEQITAETYGGLKVLCEQVVQRYFAHGGLIIRPGMIVGPYDHTGRFSSLLTRAARGGEMIVPGGDHPMQFIDVRDLARWMVSMIERRVAGVYNAVAPPTSLFSVLGEACAAACVETELTEVDASFLQEQDLDPHALDAWFLGSEPDAAFAWQVDASKAVAKGLECRSHTESVRDTLAWMKASQVGSSPRVTAEREAEVLSAWHGRATQGIL